MFLNIKPLEAEVSDRDKRSAVCVADAVVVGSVTVFDRTGSTAQVG